MERPPSPLPRKKKCSVRLPANRSLSRLDARRAAIVSFLRCCRVCWRRSDHRDDARRLTNVVRVYYGLVVLADDPGGGNGEMCARARAEGASVITRCADVAIRRKGGSAVKAGGSKKQKQKTSPARGVGKGKKRRIKIQHVLAYFSALERTKRGPPVSGETPSTHGVMDSTEKSGFFGRGGGVWRGGNDERAEESCDFFYYPKLT